eukprot:8224387-Pyramimonas_sp.AAC.1
MDQEGRLVRGLHAGVPFTLSQAAVSGEHAGVVLATACSEDGLESFGLNVDCVALRGRPAAVFGPKCFQGHFWRA